MEPLVLTGAGSIQEHPVKTSHHPRELARIVVADNDVLSQVSQGKRPEVSREPVPSHPSGGCCQSNPWHEPCWDRLRRCNRCSSSAPPCVLSYRRERRPSVVESQVRRGTLGSRVTVTYIETALVLLGAQGHNGEERGSGLQDVMASQVLRSGTQWYTNVA